MGETTRRRKLNFKFLSSFRGVLRRRHPQLLVPWLQLARSLPTGLSTYLEALSR